jgi:hypothetical protein
MLTTRPTKPLSVKGNAGVHPKFLLYTILALHAVFEMLPER